MKRFAIFCAAPLVVCLYGCVAHRSGPPAKSLTQLDVKEATPEFWMGQPGVAAARCRDFNQLWAACRLEIRDAGFRLDRSDYRQGVLSTQPMVSKQMFEVWRRDTADAHATAQSTMATVRRTVRFDIRRRPDGSFEAVPKVLVERMAASERRITSVVQYRDIFSIRRTEGDRKLDDGDALPTDYWYAEGRDYSLERRMARSVKASCIGA
jgi:hypothetical protein